MAFYNPIWFSLFTMPCECYIFILDVSSVPHVISNVAHRRRGFRQQVNPNVIESYDQLDYSYLSYIPIQYPFHAALVVR